MEFFFVFFYLIGVSSSNWSALFVFFFLYVFWMFCFVLFCFKWDWFFSHNKSCNYSQLYNRTELGILYSIDAVHLIFPNLFIYFAYFFSDLLTYLLVVVKFILNINFLLLKICLHDWSNRYRDNKYKVSEYFNEFFEINDYWSIKKMRGLFDTLFSLDYIRT